jgi:hypothetical protein
MEKSNKTLCSIFRERVKEDPVFSSIFSAIPDTDLQDLLEFYYNVFLGKKEGFDKKEWFYYFHKSIRQAGLFKNSYLIIQEDIRTQEEIDKFESLKKFLFDKWYELPKEKRVDLSRHSWWNKNYPSEYSIYMELNKKSKTESAVSYNGEMNTILWSLIYKDNSTLHIIMEKTFKEYFIESDGSI